MIDRSDEINLAASPPEINARLAEFALTGRADCSLRFTQSEEMFLLLDRGYEVPSIAIHHDLAQPHPSRRLVEAIDRVLEQLAVPLGPVLGGLQFGFDPAHPAWFYLYRIMRHEARSYLYLVTVDLSYRPLLHEVIEKGTNDAAPRYRTDRVYLAVDVMPLADNGAPWPAAQVSDAREPDARQQATTVRIERSISDTWIGESGRGYVTQGIWIDRDLNKFLTKLFTAPGQRIYPYFPFHAKYNAICHTPLNLNASARDAALPHLHEARAVLMPHIDAILQSLKEHPFSEEMPLFMELRRGIDTRWSQLWQSVRLRAYLNEHEMKEYIVEQQ